MKRDEAGMTLLEVVMGVALLAVVFLSFTNLFAGGLHASLESGRISQAALLAQEKMELLRTSSYAMLWAKRTEGHGGVLPGSENYQYFYRITGETLLFDGYPVHGLYLDLIIMQEEREVARVVSFVRKEE